MPFRFGKSERTNFLRYARGDWKFAPQENIAETPWHTATSKRTNLPAAVTELIGRARELAEVGSYLQRAEVRLVTLIGPPGIGKTRLGLEAARAALPDFQDGVFFIALAPIVESPPARYYTGNPDARRAAESGAEPPR